MLAYLIGLSLYFLVGVVVTIVLAVLAGRLGAKRKLKTLVASLSVATFVLILAWDVVPARWQFEHLCKTEAGVRIYKSVEGVKGYTQLGVGSANVEETLRRDGYQFVEATDLTNRGIRYSLDQHGELIRQQIEMPTAQFRIEAIWTPSEYVFKNVIVISDVPTKERLATRTEFYLRGGWLGKRFQELYDVCGRDEMSYKEFIAKTLKPG